MYHFFDHEELIRSALRCPNLFVGQPKFPVVLRRQTRSSEESKTELNSEIQKHEEELAKLCRENAQEIIDSKKEHLKVMEMLEKQKIEQIHKLEEKRMKVEGKINEFRLKNEMETEIRLKELEKDVNLSNYSRHFQELKQLANKIHDILMAKNFGNFSLKLIYAISTEISILYQRIDEFRNISDEYFEKRKNSCKYLMGKFEEIQPKLKISMENGTGIDDKYRTCLEMLTDVIISIPDVEKHNYLENRVRKQIKSIQ